jgi:hypothetical protein
MFEGVGLSRLAASETDRHTHSRRQKTLAIRTSFGFVLSPPDRP